MDGITDSMDMTLNKLWEIVKNRPGGLRTTRLQGVEHDLATERRKFVVHCEAVSKYL